MKNIVILFSLLLIGCSGEPSETVPQKFCTYQKTGRYQEGYYMQCMPIGSNPCGMQYPVYYVNHEYNVTCSFSRFY